MLARARARVRVLYPGGGCGSSLNNALVVLPDSDVWHARSNREHAVALAVLDRRDERKAPSAMRTHVDDTDESVRALLRTLAGAA